MPSSPAARAYQRKRAHTKTVSSDDALFATKQSPLLTKLAVEQKSSAPVLSLPTTSSKIPDTVEESPNESLASPKRDFNAMDEPKRAQSYSLTVSAPSRSSPSLDASDQSISTPRSGTSPSLSNQTTESNGHNAGKDEVSQNSSNFDADEPDDGPSDSLISVHPPPPSSYSIQSETIDTSTDAKIVREDSVPKTEKSPEISPSPTSESISSKVEHTQLSSSSLTRPETQDTRTNPGNMEKENAKEVIGHSGASANVTASASPNSKRRAEKQLSLSSDLSSQMKADDTAPKRRIQPSASMGASNRHSIAIDSPSAARLAVGSDYSLPPPHSSAKSSSRASNLNETPSFAPRRPASGANAASSATSSPSATNQSSRGDYSSLTGSQTPPHKLQTSNSSNGSPSTPSTPAVRHTKSSFFHGLLSANKSHKKDKDQKDKETNNGSSSSLGKESHTKEGKEPKEKEKDKDKSKSKQKKSKHASTNLENLRPASANLVPITQYTMEQIMHSTNVAKPDTAMNESPLVRRIAAIEPFDPAVLLSMPVQPIPCRPVRTSGINSSPHSHTNSTASTGGKDVSNSPSMPSPAVTSLQREHGYSGHQSAGSLSGSGSTAEILSSSSKKKKKNRNSEKPPRTPSPPPPDLPKSPSPVPSSTSTRARSNSEAIRPPSMVEKSNPKAAKVKIGKTVLASGSAER